MRSLRILAVIAALSAARPVAAHEFWIQPDAFLLLPNAETPVRLFRGERFQGEDLPCDEARTLAFRHLDAAGEETLRGEEGAAPAAWVTLRAPGTHLLAYRSKPATFTLDSARFNAYLLDDGLYAPLAARRASASLDRPGRERFARYAKALLVCAPGDGAPPSTAADASMSSRALGDRLEIVAETDAPALVRGASEIAVRVWFEGAPLSGAVIFAAPREAPSAGLIRAMTDAGGRARFPLDRDGPWMVSLVHMVPCTDCADADWDSSWATLVFQRGADAAPRVAATEAP